MRFLTSKTSFSAFIFPQAQIGPKNFEKIHKTVFSYYLEQTFYFGHRARDNGSTSVSVEGSSSEGTWWRARTERAQPKSAFSYCIRMSP